MVTKKLVSSKKPSPTKKASPTTKVTPEKLGLNVGVIGLGIMGSSIATNLHRAGFQVFGFDPSPKQQKLLKKIGIEVCASVSEVAQQCPYMLLSLPSVLALENVTKDIASSAKKGTIVAELGTLPHDAKEASRQLLSKKGIQLLDCPLSGTGAQAVTGDLIVFASGEKKQTVAMEPVFKGFARGCYYVGPFGQGMKMKIVANHLVAIHNVSTAESILLGIQMGLDPNMIVKVIGDGAGSSRMFQVRGPSMANRTWDKATITIDVFSKDMHLIGEAIESYSVPAPLFSSCVPVYNAAKALGHGQDDTASVYKVLEDWSATAVKKSKKSKK